MAFSLGRTCTRDQEKATCSWRKRTRTAKRLLLRSGSDSMRAFKDVPAKLAEASRITLSLSLWGWTIPWWGKYHTWTSLCESSPLWIQLAWSFTNRSSMKSVYIRLKVSFPNYFKPFKHCKVKEIMVKKPPQLTLQMRINIDTMNRKRGILVVSIWFFPRGPLIIQPNKDLTAYRLSKRVHDLPWFCCFGDIVTNQYLNTWVKQWNNHTGGIRSTVNSLLYGYLFIRDWYRITSENHMQGNVAILVQPCNFNIPNRKTLSGIILTTQCRGCHCHSPASAPNRLMRPSVINVSLQPPSEKEWVRISLSLVDILTLAGTRGIVRLHFPLSCAPIAATVTEGVLLIICVADSGTDLLSALL